LPELEDSEDGKVEGILSKIKKGKFTFSTTTSFMVMMKDSKKHGDMRRS
jgi:hypothetical protein